MNIIYYTTPLLLLLLLLLLSLSLCIFLIPRKKLLTNEFKSKKYLSFHTVFILNENIKWLEEFIIYYKHIGFDHFYLYDNEGTDGAEGSKTHNKYNFEIETQNKEADTEKLKNILQKYGDIITYIKWQPRNEKNEIVYGQNESIKDFISKYGKETTWVAFMDLDEFIFSPKDVNLPEYLRNLPKDVSCLKIVQKKFIDRFLSNNKYITQDFRCIQDLDIGTNWGSKNIVRCEDFINTNNIHTMEVKNKTLVVDKDVLRFNHYNINDKQLNWMKQFFKSKQDFKINGEDSGMIRYKSLFL
jgi:hypothetical protein